MGKAENHRLLGLLSRNEMLKMRGFSFSSAPAGGIVMDRFGHGHGIWDFDGRSYTWQSPGSTEPKFRTGDAKSAVLYTLAALDQG
jgi:hypothetical protein